MGIRSGGLFAEGGNQRLVARLKNRTSFKTHNSSGFVESDWRAIPPKTTKLLFPEVPERGRGETGVGEFEILILVNVRGLTDISAMKVPRSGLIRIRALRDLLPSEGFDIEHVDVCDHPPFRNEATTLGERRVRIGYI